MCVPTVYNDVTIGNMQHFLSQLQMAEFILSLLYTVVHLLSSLNVKGWAAVPACSGTEAKHHFSVPVPHERGDSIDECPLEAVICGQDWGMSSLMCCGGTR